MTTENTLQRAERFRLPDPPPRELDEMTAYDQIYRDGNNHHLAMHFGHRDTTLIEYDRWVIASPEDNRARARRPDLLIAFNVSREDYEASNGYIISEQGKPPDFVLEVASESTAAVDTGPKQDDYAALGIPEYWRFDKTGDLHGAKLAGDILEGNSYQPVLIEEVAPEILQGYSPTLNLIIRWDHGRLVWWDPDTRAPILTYEDQREARLQAEVREGLEREARIQADARAEEEREARIRAEERATRMEEELRRLREDELP